MSQTRFQGWTRCETVLTYVHDGDGLFAGGTEVLDHVLDEHAALGHLALWEAIVNT